MPHRQTKPFTVEVRRSRLQRPTILSFQRLDQNLGGSKSSIADSSYEAALQAARAAFEDFDQIGDDAAPETAAAEPKQPRILPNLNKEDAYSPEQLVLNMKAARLAERQRKKQELAEAKLHQPPVEEAPSEQAELPIPAPEPTPELAAEPQPVIKPPKRVGKAKEIVQAIVEPPAPAAPPVPATPRQVSRRHAQPVLLAGEKWKRRLRWVK